MKIFTTTTLGTKRQIERKIRDLAHENDYSGKGMDYIDDLYLISSPAPKKNWSKKYRR